MRALRLSSLERMQKERERRLFFSLGKQTKKKKKERGKSGSFLDLGWSVSLTPRRERASSFSREVSLRTVLLDIFHKRRPLFVKLSLSLSFLTG